MPDETRPGLSDETASRADPTDGGRKILRFRRTERLLHWAIAIPFLFCWVTAAVLVIAYNPAPERPYREIFSWIHRGAGIGLTVLPLLAVLRTTGEIRFHFDNVCQAWAWTLQDIRWLSMLGLAAISKRVELPEQGKFNAAEKLNFMMLMTCYPLYIMTGATIWLTHGAFVSWVLHFLMAVFGTPLVLGHIFMATVNPDTRVGLQGMISGYVDRQWAKHHYRRWYREQLAQGRNPDADPNAPSPRPTPATATPSPSSGAPLREASPEILPFARRRRPRPSTESRPGR